ncbi:2-succinyl-5-enolpyruvyl-6-hydroxy-3-cyclohexene-1-carboxylic-acid synthase [bacterium]|nr:2-succinyl-5-enolpyruvyl-6-hydroxy-3-cyclohexene-1-carboxylic-acid synthase [bacterium]
MNPVNVNLLHASVLIGELAKYGARRAVISPGSRSAPLAVAAHSFPGLKTYTILDERSAAFFALGLSKADGKPVILICTSGTAAANYFPAVIEASRWGVLLVVLTADRPAALRQTGAPQTIDQTHLYGNFVRFFADVPEAKLDIERCRAVQSIAAEACAAATGSNPGPVHLNVPLDEPLAPIPESATEVKRLWTALRDEATERPAPRIETEPPEGAMRPVRQLVTESLCGLIVAGPGAASSFEEAEPIFHLARKLGWPLLADVVSGVRLFDEPVAPFYDFFLRTEELAALAPDVVLHLGGFPTSKMLAQYLDRHRAAQTFRIGRSFQAGDPLFREGMFIESSPAIFCRELAKRLGPSRDSLLLEPFQRASRLVSEELEHVTRESNDDCEALVTLAALNALKEEWNIVLASSLPVRYGDALFATQGRLHRVYGLRGVNGIDGTLSHAAGIATASGRPTLLVTGDLALVTI